ncbi:tyrosine-type recombinase/integrase [Amycolatopsis methanolica]|uniref:tyrosine-type recombinase/integrase n=1 Tax=Amycolatopsis methanolica TaxID=1814 RepID=UPI00342EF904
MEAVVGFVACSAGEVEGLPRWGRVVPGDTIVPWRVVDEAGRPVGPIEVFVRELMACGASPASARSYCYGLLRWWRWLMVVDVAWDRATPDEAREFVLWLTQARKPRNSLRTASARTAGTVNVVTRKPYLDDRYQARTVRHGNAVIRSFYEFWLERGGGPLINPIPLDKAVGWRRRSGEVGERPQAPGRVRYNPKLPKRSPREVPDGQWKAFFGELRSNRDRALVAIAVSCAARAAELLGLRGVDIDWGEQLVCVVRKGSRAQQWLPVSSEALVWLRLYLSEVGEIDPSGPLWWTLRRRDHGAGLTRQPLNYEALRAVLRRLNARLGTNWTFHDLRHTAALRMARDDRLSMRDVQMILGHAHLSTTADVYAMEEQAQVLRQVAHYLAERQRPRRPVEVTSRYDQSDLSVLFGGDQP